MAQIARDILGAGVTRGTTTINRNDPDVLLYIKHLFCRDDEDPATKNVDHVRGEASLGSLGVRD
jgi:hypothetical protein